MAWKIETISTSPQSLSIFQEILLNLSEGLSWQRESRLLDLPVSPPLAWLSLQGAHQPCAFLWTTRELLGDGGHWPLWALY